MIPLMEYPDRMSDLVCMTPAPFTAYRALAPERAVTVDDFTRMVSLTASADTLAEEGDESSGSDEYPQYAYWEGVIGMENTMTGDGRLIEDGALRWENLPIPLRVVFEDAGAHDGALVAGRMFTIERKSGGVIWASGDFDMGSEPGRKAYRLVRDGYMTGVSMDLDDVSFEIRLAKELISAMEEDEFPVNIDPDEDGNVTVASVKATDEMRVTTSARVRASTLVSIPAFAEARIGILDKAPEWAEGQNDATYCLHDGCGAEATEKVEFTASLAGLYCTQHADLHRKTGKLSADVEGFSFNPRQLRIPKGNPNGGEWMDTPGTAINRALDRVSYGDDNMTITRLSEYLFKEPGDFMTPTQVRRLRDAGDQAQVSVDALDEARNVIDDALVDGTSSENLSDQLQTLAKHSQNLVDNLKEASEVWNEAGSEAQGFLADDAVEGFSQAASDLLALSKVNFDEPPAIEEGDVGLRALSTPFTVKRTALTASGAPIEPPLAWFRNPELKEPTPLTVTDDGRVYGHLALWGTCHTGAAQHGSCVTPPHSSANYAHFRTGSVLTKEGTEVATGRITLDTKHANTRLGMTAAANHYDDTGNAVADIVTGEDAYGIWFSGALRPEVTPEKVRVLRGSPLSGDWRRVGGSMELTAVLAVNMPGFPVPRPHGLVASGVVQTLVASGMLPPKRVIAPGKPGALSLDDIKYLKRLAARERAEEQNQVTDTATVLAQRVRASAADMKVRAFAAQRKEK